MTDNMPPHFWNGPESINLTIREYAETYARAYAEQQTRELQDSLEWEKMRSGSNRREAEELRAELSRIKDGLCSECSYQLS